MENYSFKNTKNLAKNPLGIIALFISLIYGFACLVLSTSIKNLDSESERLPLIWFIILFPLIILAAFLYLVINHHKKLYAPSDFRDESNFIETTNDNRQKERIQEEVDTIIEDEKDKKVDGSEDKNGNNSEVKIKENLKEQYLLAEDLALRAYELEKNISINRHSSYVSRDQKIFEFDGIGTSKSQNVYMIEVKYLTLKYLSTSVKNRIESFLKEINDNYENLRISNLIPVVIVVCKQSEIDEIEKSLQNISNSFKHRAEIKVYEMKKLKEKFGLN